MIPDPVRVSGGLVAGVLEAAGSVRAYKGIPFAAPPVGPLRWRAPQPVAPWAGVRIADRFGSACLQPLVPRDGIMNLFSFAEPPECGMSEDCLYLNVWTGARSPDERLPVIVWIFGGGFRVGSGSHPVSGGTHLARRGAVVVTLNYRVGALGFLAHPELTREDGASGNYACMDVIAALRWVRDNIAAFGGDPNCVAIYGQSAGAALASILMASPEAQGLFHRAIGGSGGRFDGGMMGAPMKSLCAAEKSGAEFLEGLGARTLEEIRNVPADTLYGPRGLWGPIVDGKILNRTVQQAFSAGAQARVAMLTGFCADEASPYPNPPLHTLGGLKSHAETQFAENAQALLDLYPAATDAQASEQSYRITRDSGFGYQAWKWASLHSETGRAPTYMYYFSRAVPLPAARKFREPMPRGGYGAWHGSELWYAFDTLDTQPFPWEPVDREVAATFSSALVQFARSGQPGPEWPRFNAHEAGAMVIGERLGAGSLPNREALQFFTSHYATSQDE